MALQVPDRAPARRRRLPASRRGAPGCARPASPCGRPRRRGSRAVAAFLDVRGERRPDEHRAHLLRDRSQPGADDLQLDRNHGDPPKVTAFRASPSRRPNRPAPRRSRPRARAPAGHVRPDVRARDGHARRPPDLRGPHCDELEPASRIRVPVALRVRRREIACEIRPQRDGQLERLADVAKSASPSSGSTPISSSGMTYERTVSRRSSAATSPERRKDACCRGYEHRRHPELVGERARMQWPGAPERDEREVARVEPLLDGDDAERAHHLGVHDLDHGGRFEAAERASARLPRRARRHQAAATGSRPSSRLASVTVARSPPRP